MAVTLALHAAVFLTGVLVVVALLSAVPTFVLPCSASDPVTRFVFAGCVRSSASR